jgi:hypothetical protein
MRWRLLLKLPIDRYAVLAATKNGDLESVTCRALEPERCRAAQS